MKETFNKCRKSLVPLLLVFSAAAGVSGCATISPPGNSMSDDNIAYIQRGVNFYRQTGASPVNYDACGALRSSVEGGGNTGGGTILGAAAGGVVLHSLTHSPAMTVLGILGGGIAGNQVSQHATGNIDQLNRDCQLQQAISRETGGSAYGGSVTYQPGGIYRRY